MGGSSSREEDDKHEEDHQQKELEKEKDNPDNKKIEADPDEFKGPSDISKRKTTDCCCMILLMANWFAMTMVGFAVTGVYPSESLPVGNPSKLTHTMDYNGRICGVSSEVQNKEYAYFMASGSAVCVKKCPKETSYTDFICEDDAQEDVDSQITTSLKAAVATVYTGTYQCLPEIATVPGPGYTCVYNPYKDKAANETLKLTDDDSIPEMPSADQFEDFQGDLVATWPLILVFGFIVAMICGFVFLRILRIPFLLDIIVWGCIIAVFSLLFGIGMMCKFSTATRWKEEDPQTHTDTEIKMIEGVGYFFLGLAALWTCFICCVLTRIRLAIGITKESAKAMAAMTSLIFFPVIQTFGILLFSAPWFTYMIFLASSGDMVKSETTYSTTAPFPEVTDDDSICAADEGACITVQTTDYIYADATYQAYWYLLFMWFWTSEFIMAIGQIVVAMSVAFWYFERDKSKINSLTVSTAIRVTFRYHSGTAAFGSLIIAIIKLIRAMIAYLQKNADKLAKRGAMGGMAAKTAATVAKAVLCCLQCCMWCIEKCAKFLNKHAYIQTAIFSYSFCKAARKAFFLILRNILLIGAVAMVSEFVLMLLLVLIPVTTAFIAYCAFDTMDELNSVFGPTLFVFILAYFTAKKFTETFGMVISTILQCYVADTEMFDPEKRFAGGSLKAAISNGNSEAKKKKGAIQVAPAPNSEDGEK